MVENLSLCVDRLFHSAPPYLTFWRKKTNFYILIFYFAVLLNYCHLCVFSMVSLKDNVWKLSKFVLRCKTKKIFNNILLTTTFRSQGRKIHRWGEWRQMSRLGWILSFFKKNDRKFFCDQLCLSQPNVQKDSVQKMRTKGCYVASLHKKGFIVYPY